LRYTKLKRTGFKKNHTDPKTWLLIWKVLNAHCASFTQATAEANNLTAVAAAKDTYNRAMEQVELLSDTIISSI